MRTFLLLTAIALSTSACAYTYSLIEPETVAVAKDTMSVRPSRPWNKAPKGEFDIPRQETWTLNGLMLDSITFIGALPDGEAIAKQRPKDDRKVPIFRSNMTPQDLESMLESFYRIKEGAAIFEITAVAPASFAGKPGIQFDYDYAGTDEVKRRGRCMLAVVDGELFMISLDAAALHYFEAALPEFQAVVASASITS